MNPLISICIPTYNQPEYLKKTLDSIQAQTYKNYEIIISDDSPNNSIETVVNTYKSLPIQYIKNKTSLGSPKNWNNALDYAKGEFIKILHHDDWFNEETALEEFFSEIIKHSDCSFVFCYSKTTNHKRYKNGIHKITSREFKKIKNKPEYLMVGNHIGSPSVTFFKKNNFRFDENLKWLVDIDFYIQLLKNNNNYILIKKPLMFITGDSPQQVTRSCQNIEVEFSEWLYLYKKYKNKTFFNFSETFFLLRLIVRYKVISIDQIPLFPTKIHTLILTILIFINKLIIKPFIYRS